MKLVKVLAVVGFSFFGAVLLLTMSASRLTSVYKFVAIIPIQQDVSLSRIGDHYFNVKNYESAAQYYRKAEPYSSQPHKCILFIKAGDSNNNAAISQDDTEQKIQYLQAASDQYGRCLAANQSNGIARNHKKITDEQLKKLLEHQANQSQATPQPDPATPLSDTTTEPVINW